LDDVHDRLERLVIDKMQFVDVSIVGGAIEAGGGDTASLRAAWTFNQNQPFC
jgi:hypothetical protein